LVPNQKRIKNFKKRFRKENKKYTFPVCETECQYLTCAHIGATQSGIIYEVQLQAAEERNNLEKLYDILRENTML
jgi:acyl-CoA thioesterase FadM